VRTGAGEGFAVVRYPDSTQLELSTGTVLRLLEAGGPDSSAGKRVFLQEGYVTADVHRQPSERPMILMTPSAEIRVLGTRFRSLSTLGETRVELEEGRVQMIRRTDGKAIEVSKGCFAVATERAPESFTPRPLPARLTRRPLTLADPAGPVANIAYSPDGRSLASGGWHGAVKIWDPLTGALLRTLEGHVRRINCLAYAPDGKTLYTAGADRTVRAWDVATGMERYAVKKLPREVVALAASADGQVVALTGAFYRGNRKDRRASVPTHPSHLILLRDAATGLERRSFPAPGDGVRTMAFAPNGLLALGCFDGTVTLWDAAAGRAIRKFEGLGGTIRSVAFSADGRWLAAGNQDSTVRLWDLTNRTSERTLFSRTREVRSVAFSPDTHYLAAGGNAGLVTIWDVEQGQERLVFRAHKHAVGAVAFAPDGCAIASSGWDRCVKIWPLVAD
jgi:WD40 repeat protein